MNEERPLIVKPLRRLLSFLMDIFIFFILTSGIYSFGVANLMNVFPFYKDAMNQQRVAVDEIKDMYIDGRLIKIDSSGIAYTNSEFVDYYITKGIKREAYDESGALNDNITYFYVSYASTLTYTDVESYIPLTIKDVNEHVFAPYDLEGTKIFEYLDNDVNKPALLTEEAAKHIITYRKGDINAVNEAVFLKFKSFIQDELINAEKALNASDEYKVSYKTMMKYNDLLYLYTSISVTITYTVFFALYFILVPFLLKNGQTFGKRIMKMEVKWDVEKDIPFQYIALRSILQYVSYFFVCLFIPMFQLGISILKLPLLRIGNFTFSMGIFAIFTFVISLASFIYMCVNNDHQALHDKMVQAYVYDKMAIDDLMQRKAEQLEREKEEKQWK